MRAALNQLFTQRYEDEEAKLRRKIETRYEEIMIYYFYVFTNCGPLKGEGGAWANRNVFNAPFLNTAMLDTSLILYNP